MIKVVSMSSEIKGDGKPISIHPSEDLQEAQVAAVLLPNGMIEIVKARHTNTVTMPIWAFFDAYAHLISDPEFKILIGYRIGVEFK